MAVYYTNAGKAITTNRIKGAGTEPLYVAWGTGAVAASATSTTLSVEASEARVAGTTTQQTTTTTGDTWRCVATITANGTKTITNAGCFDAATAGNLMVIGDAMSYALALNDAIQFTFSIAFA